MQLSSKSFLKRSMAARRGATAIEYALIAGGIALAIVAAVFLLGGTLEGFFSGSAQDVLQGGE